MMRMDEAHGHLPREVATDAARPALRARIERFAALRAASRALPVSAGAFDQIVRWEAGADGIRRSLERLAEHQDEPETLAELLARDAGSLDDRLEGMASDILARLDEIDFPGLRAHLPRVVESHRREGLALLDVLLLERGDRGTRLGKIEYLVTLLATEVHDGRRTIAHDPVGLTPALRRLAMGASTRAAGDVAIEIHQAASLDFDSEDPMRSLARLRMRKQELGLGRFAPEILRAIVTYNARMFNWIESTTDSSRTSDSVVEEMLASAAEFDGDPPPSGAPDPAAGRSSSGPIDGGESAVFRSAELAAIVAAFRLRLQGRRIGAGGAERVALALDESHLDSLERESILADPRSPMQRVVAYFAVVGLMLRDRGAIQPELLDLGVTQAELANEWMGELERATDGVVSALLTHRDGARYDLAGVVSGIRTKHLLASRSVVRLERGPSAVTGSSASDPGEACATSRERARILRAAAADVGGRTDPSPGESRGIGSGQAVASARSIGRKRLVHAALAAVLVAAAAVALWRPPSGTTATLGAQELSRLSRHLVSAYRSDRGAGRLLVGRVDAAFERLDPVARAEAVAALMAQLRRASIREAMLYDARGVMQVHYAGGALRVAPAPPGPIDSPKSASS